MVGMLFGALTTTWSAPDVIIIFPGFPVHRYFDAPGPNFSDDLMGQHLSSAIGAVAVIDIPALDSEMAVLLVNASEVERGLKVCRGVVRRHGSLFR